MCLRLLKLGRLLIKFDIIAPSADTYVLFTQWTMNAEEYNAKQTLNISIRKI